MDDILKGRLLFFEHIDQSRKLKRSLIVLTFCHQIDKVSDGLAIIVDRLLGSRSKDNAKIVRGLR